jgi:hypothetical protein
MPGGTEAAAGGGCGCNGHANGCGNGCGCCKEECDKCCNSLCGHQRCCELECPEADVWRLCGEHCFLGCHKINVYGWLAAGFTFNEHEPIDNYNGVLTFNDRDEELMGNQLYLVTEKAIDNEGCGWDWGGRVDLLYGTDHRFTMARGLELHDDLSNKWNGERFYGLAAPQFYFDLAYNDTTFRFGHFYTTAGYEVVPAPNNFFYSHAFTMQYGEPFTKTGMMVMHKFSDRLNAHFCVHRGWDNFEDHPGNDQLDYMAGATVTSEDGDGTLTLVGMTGEEPSAIGFAPRNFYSLVYQRKFGCKRWTYVLQNDYGVQEDGVVSTIPGAPAVDDAEWYGINQYLFYQINCCWSMGGRVEWFRDDDGTRVTGIGAGNLVAGASFPGNFWGFTWGLNWKPNDNLVVRPEVRYDTFDGVGLPYDGGTDDSQWTFALDAIIHW